MAVKERTLPQSSHESLASDTSHWSATIGVWSWDTRGKIDWQDTSDYLVHFVGGH